MANESTARLEYVDVELSRRLFDRLTATTNEMEVARAAQPAKLAQRRYGILSGNFRMIAEYAYALGAPYSEVVEYLRKSAEAIRKVFELREHPEGLTVERVTITVDRLTNERVVDREAISGDASLTNSRAGLDGIYMALIAGQPLTAQRLAQMIGDPPDAPYLSGDSEVCTPDDQHMAYAIKKYLAGDSVAAKAELDRVANEDPAVAAEASLARSIMTSDRDDFLRALKGHLKSHATEAKKKRNQKDPMYFLNLVSLGLALLAAREGVVAIDDLPRHEPHFPVELLESAFNP